MGSPQQSLSPARPSHQQNLQDKTDEMEDNLAATFDAGNSFNSKLRDTLQGLLAANNERKSEIDALRGDHDQLKSDHEALVNTTERENSLRKNEIKSLDSWAKGENDSRKKEIEDLKNFAEKENDARKTHIANLENFAKSENDARKADIAALNARADAEAAARDSEDKALSDRIFTCPTGGTYLFMFHIATHDNKKALLSIRKNGEEIASIFDQNHKDNHKNSMAGQNIIRREERRRDRGV